MPQQLNLKSKGLFTYDNQLSAIPEGALLEASNIVINSSDIIESRRGNKIYGNSFGIASDRSKQLLSYKERIIRHYTDKLQFDSDGSGTFATFSGSYNSPESGLRMRGVEANGNYLFTTDTGIKKISATGSSDFSTSANYIIEAGVPKALEVTGAVNYSAAGFFNVNSKVSYRIVWGYYDANNILLLGSPSPRLILTNTSETQSASSDITIAVPDGITVNHFYQIYRTPMVEKTVGLDFEDIDPGDEHYLVYEANPTSAEITAEEVAFNDITPETFRQSGTLLYTNPISGDGIQQSNDIPPLAKDLALFSDSMFYANTKTRHRMDFSFLSVDDYPNNKIISSNSVANPTVVTTTTSHGLETNDVVYIFNSNSTPSINGTYTITKLSSSTFSIPVNVTVAGSTGIISQTPQIVVSDGQNSNVYSFRGYQEKTTITCISSASLPASPNFGYLLINSPSNERKYFFWFDTTVLNNGVQPSNPDTLDRIAVKVSVPPAFTASDVAQALVVELNLVGLGGGDFTSSNIGAIVTLYHNFNGATTDVVDGTNVTGFTIVTNEQGVGEDYPAKISLLSNLASIAQQVDETARSFVSTINKQTTEEINAYYLSSTDDVPGQLNLERNSIVDEKFYIACLTDRIKGEFNPALPKASYITTISTGSTTVTINTGNDHQLISGNQIAITNTTTTPSIRGLHTATVTSASSFTITVPVALSSSSSGGIVFKSSVVSDNEVKPNRLYYSKFQQFESVPILNYFDVGQQDKPIRRIIALRDGLFILKDDGIFRLTGQNASFGYNLFDRNIQISSPDTAVALNNQINVLTLSGVVSISDTGVSVISRAIEGDILKRISNNYINQSTAAFGVGYESDRAYLLFLADSPTDTVAMVCYRYNYYTQSWTTFDLSKTCGIINEDDRLYLGAADSNNIEIERKDFDRTDFSDREYSLSLSSAAIDNTNLQIQLSSVQNVSVGDVIEQTQYVTISQFNRLLKKLDLDPSLTDSDYFSILEIDAGDSLSTKMAALVAKLNIDDTSTVYVFSGATDFATIQTEFNALIIALNASAGTFYVNYKSSSGTVKYEIIATSVNKSTIKISVDFIPPFIIGPLKSYESIGVAVEWAPQTFGDPSSLKHFTEGTFLFQTFSFHNAIVSYKSDLSQNFEPIAFDAQGNGLWGSFFWGESTWGGEGSQIPFRTFIPRDKQRCRYISCKFVHKISRDIFKILGLSITGKLISTRAYR